MTYPIDSDSIKNPGKKNQNSLFPSSDLETSGIRLTRAEFSRMMGCSKQAVTDWVKAGRIVVGADGRFDPSQAVRSLLATGDPAKIRARVLMPLTAEMTQLRTRLAALQKELDAERANEKFYEGCNAEMLANWSAIGDSLYLGWQALRKLDAERLVECVRRWQQACLERGPEWAGPMENHIRPCSLIQFAEPLPKIEDPCLDHGEIDE